MEFFEMNVSESFSAGESGCKWCWPSEEGCKWCWPSLSATTVKTQPAVNATALTKSAVVKPTATTLKKIK